eukprot:CAMPEP_0204398162 /NCGR_PEP_ID=MMETSP0470-20130426/2594_1 /ASSEMBLY_ACC=CAM_ASM_000385 /TAXON_ID=2969 /ORGANISM="Oxyrrhis marina" /LENGTH=45 /DNA_ID= /DNA_START= /DNA_END= /DNA_ORIENTATION=
MAPAGMPRPASRASADRASEGLLPPRCAPLRGVCFGNGAEWSGAE